MLGLLLLVAVAALASFAVVVFNLFWASGMEEVKGSGSAGCECFITFI